MSEPSGKWRRGPEPSATPLYLSRSTPACPQGSELLLHRPVAALLPAAPPDEERPAEAGEREPQQEIREQAPALPQKQDHSDRHENRPGRAKQFVLVLPMRLPPPVHGREEPQQPEHQDPVPDPEPVVVTE